MSIQRAMPALFCFGDCGQSFESSLAADAPREDDAENPGPSGEAGAIQVLYQGASPGAQPGSRPSRGKPVRAFIARIFDGLGLRVRAPAYART